MLDINTAIGRDGRQYIFLCSGCGKERHILQHQIKFTKTDRCKKCCGAIRAKRKPRPFRPCSINGCLNQYKALGLCKYHYDQRRRSLETPERKQAKFEFSHSTKGRYARLKYAAKLRGEILEITFEQYQLLLDSKPCHYCNSSIGISGHGLDRKNTNIGYILDNVVPCCDACNTMKSYVLTYEEMKIAMDAVLNYRNKNYD